MADMPYKFAATADNFMTAVVEASNTKPVLVDFWAPWCGPCQTLMPMLERIADDYEGRFLLAKVNTDEEQQLATHFQVRSIPMVMLIHNGEIAEQFVGVQPEAAIKALLDKYLGDATATGTDAAVSEDEAGGVAGEEPSWAALGDDPSWAAPGEDPSWAATRENQSWAAVGDEGSGPALSEGVSAGSALRGLADGKPADVAMHCLTQRDAAGAAAAIAAFAAEAPEIPEGPLLKSLRARLAFVELANAHPDTQALRTRLDANPGDVAARHALAAHYALLGDYGTALAEWLEVMRRDRKFEDDAGRRALVQAFDVLGDQDPLVIQYRRRLASLLH